MTTHTITKLDIAKELLRNLQRNNLKHSRDPKVLTGHIDALLDEIEYQLDRGNRVSLLRVGMLRAISKAGRPGRIPKLGQSHWIPPRRTVTFYGSGKTGGYRGGKEPKICTSELREIMAEEMGTQQKGAVLVDTFLEQLSRVKAERCRVELRYFGVFSCQETNPRITRNPATGKKKMTESYIRIQFKVSSKMVERLTDSYIERYGEIVKTPN